MRYFVYTNSRSCDNLKWSGEIHLISESDLDIEGFMEDYELDDIPTPEDMLNHLCDTSYDGGYPGEWFELVCNNGRIEYV